MDEIICEGFLTKSPPERKINRARWHKRWFVLRRLRGNFILQYFKDRNSVTPKGTIHLNACEQVDQGLTFESKKFHNAAYIFDIVTPKRKYFLVACSEEDMIRWVRNICEVCGFHLDGSDPNEDVGVQAQPMTIHHQQDPDPEPRYTDEPIRSLPTQSNGTLEDGYFELSDSVTGEGRTSTDGPRLPAKSLHASISGRDSGVATLDEPLDIQSFESSGSSVPSDSAPPPPPKTPTTKTTDRTLDGANDIYDTPPVHHRHSITSDSGAIYDCPPLRRPSHPIDSVEEMESLYKTVPPPRPSKSSSLDYPMSPLNNGSVFEHQDNNQMASDIYDVPPAGRELPIKTRQVYDTPPVGYLKNEELSQSTDNLAKKFQDISFRNSMGTNSVTSDNVDFYDIPNSPNSLNDSGHFPGSLDHGPVSPPIDMVPPRPPKPAHLQAAQDPTTPPPSFDDTYNIPLNLQPQPQMNAADLHKRLSQEIQGDISDQYATPPAWGGHTWMDNNTATTKPRYINTKRTEPQTATGMPVNQLPSRSSLDGTIPAPDPNSYVNVRNERYVFSPKPKAVQSCYLPMQGSSGNSSSFGTSFEYCDETYMAMEGAIDGTADSYTFMQSPSGASGPPPVIPRAKSMSVSSRNSQGELPPPIPRSLSTSSRNSQGEVPPPVNRNSKPDRRSTQGSVSSHTSDLAALTGVGSFYATPEDAFDVGNIIPSARTQSFSKGPGVPQKAESLLQDSFRRRTNTDGSTTSSSGESGVGGQETHYVTPTDGRHQPTMTDEVYVLKDPPPLTPKLEKAQAAAAQPPKEAPTFESIADTNIPPLIVEEVESSKIEYLELDHTKNEKSPPPRPPKPVDSTKVEYFDLDPQKTKALRDITEERQKESYNKAT